MNLNATEVFESAPPRLPVGGLPSQRSTPPITLHRSVMAMLMSRRNQQMPVEIEAKMRFEDLDALRERLRTVGATYRKRVVETNIFFDTDDRSLLAADEGLRVRVNRNAQTGEEDVLVTFKGPRQHGQLKSREETELTVADADAASALFERLGFGRVLSFAKRRESWKVDGCSVELDELPYLGSFVEIEGPTEEQVLAAKKKLGLAELKNVKASYIAMLMTHLQEHGIANRVVTFEQAM